MVTNETITTERTNQLDVQLLQRYEDALRLANPGINPPQARTMVYWALATYFDFNPKPLLLIYKAFGCGKSDLLSTLLPMTNRGKIIEGNSYATVRDELADRRTCTAFFDERDDDRDAVPESLLRKRFKVENSLISVNRARGDAIFDRQQLNINGWTAVARRSLFHDSALLSRCAVISPEQAAPEALVNARVTNMGSLQLLKDLLGDVDLTPGKGRAAEVWKPLISIAVRFIDTDWIAYASSNVAADAGEDDLTRHYEPEEAIESAFQICASTPNHPALPGGWIKISDVRRTVNAEFDQDFKPAMVAATLRRKGHSVSVIDGYPAVRNE